MRLTIIDTIAAIAAAWLVSGAIALGLFLSRAGVILHWLILTWPGRLFIPSDQSSDSLLALANSLGDLTGAVTGIALFVFLRMKRQQKITTLSS
jgi:hypothetical protein